MEESSLIARSSLWRFVNSLRPLFEEGIFPGITNAGYEAVRDDRTQHNNKIDDEIIALIRRCKFVVADFSLNCGGIYFEAGFAMGLNRPVIWTAREDRLNRITSTLDNIILSGGGPGKLGSDSQKI